MEMMGRVRRMKLRDGMSNSEIAKRTGLSRNTVKKWLNAAGDAAQSTSAPRAKPPSSAQIGMTVETPQVQNMVDRMITANLIHRQSHGVYAAADPFVRQVWRQRKTMQLPGQAPGAEGVA